MARIRSIKPEFPQSESIGRLSRDARLLFIQLWTIVDDDGRARAASRMLASLLYPYDDDAPGLIDGWLSELEAEGCVRRYEVDGTSYVEIPKWLKHQKIDRPSKSKLPPFSDEFAKPRESSRSLATDLGPRIKEEDLGEERKSTTIVVSAPRSARDDSDLGPELSDEDEFWKLASELSGQGVARSRLGQLAKLYFGDFRAALVTAREVQRAEQPGAYLGKIIANLKREQAPESTLPAGDSSEPDFVRSARAEGFRVARHPNGWKIGGDLFDASGQVIGW